MATSRSRRNITKLINRAVQGQPIHKAFVCDLMKAIEQRELNSRNKPSKYYKPSSLICLRQMYFTRIGAEQDNVREEYTGIGMADTGSRRHVAIQEALIWMNSQENCDWEYVDVEEYIKYKQSKGKCLNLIVKGKRGAETHLIDTVLGVSFMCDGIIRNKHTGVYYLFEFKNQVSFKYYSKDKVDEEHIAQVSTYCMELDLDYAFVVYENRDVCELNCPELFHVTDEMKQAPVEKILECESYVERLIPPPKHPDDKPCRWCRYKTECRKAGAR